MRSKRLMGREEVLLLSMLGLQLAIPARAAALIAGPSVYLSQAITDGTDDAASLFKQGKAAMQSGQFEMAEKDFKRVIALDPKSAAPLINLGVTYMREKRWDEALIELRKAQSLAPNESGIQLNIGLTYYRKDDFPSAINPLVAALQLAPDSLQARYLLGLCYFFTNKYKDASAALSPLWERESNDLNYLYVLSIAASKSSDSALQQRAFAQMLAVGQNKPEFHLYLGKAWLAEGATEKALEEFHAAEAARPELPLVHYFLGRTYLEQHDYPKAEAELEKSVAVEPDFAYSYEDLGILYAEQGQPKKAEQYFRGAIERNKALGNSWFGLAKLYREEHRYPEALEALDHAEKLAPNSAGVHYTRGQVLARLGQSDKAHQEFEASSRLLNSFNERIQRDPSGDLSADAQDAAEQ